MTLLRLVLGGLKPYVIWVLLVVLFQIAGVLAALYLPTLNADIIDDGVAKADVPVIWELGRIMLVISLGNIIALVAANFFAARSAMRVGKDLRQAVFRRVNSFSPRELAEFGTPSLVTRSTNDVQQVQMLIFFSLNMLVQAPVTGIGGVVLALRVEPGMAWLIAVMVPVMLVAVGILILKAAPLFKQMQGKIDDINGVLREQITGIRVLRAFVREDRERERYAVVNGELTELNRRIGLLMILINPIIMFILNMSSVLVLLVAAPRIDSGQMEIGSITAFIAYLMQILIAVMMATFMTMMIPRAMVSAERITEVLETETSVHQRTDGIREIEGPIELTFEDVSFTYPGAERPVLQDISFTARAGQTVAIIGGTGAGKTTLINLVPRLMDATEGRVLLNGHDVRDLDARVLWDRVGLVPQRPYLFSGTVATNLRFGNPDADEQELWHALTVAQGRDFVAAMPEQLASPIAQGGTNVSGGQRQRLCIARTLVAAPRVFVFDDSFSALDVTTDARVREGLAQHTRGATTIIVAQRISTITSADQILVLEEGRIVGRGTHEELLESSETYREIVDSQITAEEMA